MKKKQPQDIFKISPAVEGTTLLKALREGGKSGVQFSIFGAFSSCIPAQPCSLPAPLLPPCTAAAQLQRNRGTFVWWHFFFPLEMEIYIHIKARANIFLTALYKPVAGNVSLLLSQWEADALRTRGWCASPRSEG